MTNPFSRSESEPSDEGTALVEFAFVMLIFLLLLFGIIAFGVILSFKQTMTQAASEASRAAAVTTDDPGTATVDERVQAAENSVAQFNSYDRPCTKAEMTCTTTVHDCGSTIDTTALPDCITVTLSYDYESDPIVPEIPLIQEAIPDTLTSSSTSQISDPGP